MAPVATDVERRMSRATNAPPPDALHMVTNTGTYQGARKMSRLMHASSLVQRARAELVRAKEAGEKIEVRTQFIDGASGGTRPNTSGGSAVLYREDEAGDASTSSPGYTSRVLFARRREAEEARRRLHGKALHPALTTRIVAHATDYRDRYCGACEFEDQPRCTFCHCSKLSVFRRMPLVRMARELLTLRPTISATQLAREVSRYATSDDAATRLNEKVEGWWQTMNPHQAFLCDRHGRMKDDVDENEKAYRDEIARLAFQLEASRVARKRDAGEVARLQKVLYHEHLDEDELRGRIRALERELDMMRIAMRDKDARLQAALGELTDLKSFAPDVGLAATQTEVVRRKGAHTQSDFSASGREHVKFKILPWGTTVDAEDILGAAEPPPEGPASPLSPPSTPVQARSPKMKKFAGSPKAPVTKEIDLAEDDDDDDDDDESVGAAPEGAFVEELSSKRKKKKLKKLKKERYANARYDKLNKLPKGKAAGVALQQLLVNIYSVYESKVLGDKQDVDEGRPCDPLSVDLRDHFRKTLGLRKLANQKVAETINATKHLMSKSRRVFVFAWLLGLDISKHAPDGMDLLYSPQLSRAFFSLFFAVIAKVTRSTGTLKGVKEYLLHHPEGDRKALVERKALCQLLVGVTRPKSATGSRPASRDGDGDMTPDERKAFIGRVDPGDWTCEDLKKVMTVAEIKKLLLAFADLPRVAPRTTDTRNTIRSVDFVDLDDALWTVLVHGSEALSRHCENLTHLFYKFDCDKPGLSKTEFHDLWRYAAGGDAPVVLKDVDRVHFDIEDVCDGDGDPDDDDELIDNAANFALAALKVDCMLAHSARCLDHWARVPDDDPLVKRGAPPRAPSFRRTELPPGQVPVPPGLARRDAGDESDANDDDDDARAPAPAPAPEKPYFNTTLEYADAHVAATKLQAGARGRRTRVQVAARGRRSRRPSDASAASRAGTPGRKRRPSGAKLAA